MSSAGGEKEQAPAEENKTPGAAAPGVGADKDGSVTTRAAASGGEPAGGQPGVKGFSDGTTGGAPKGVSDRMAVVREPKGEVAGESKGVVITEKKEPKEVLPGSPLTSVGLDISRIDTFELGNYTFGRKETEVSGQDARGVDAKEIAAHREKRFLERGMRRSVAAVLLVHTHKFPHLLLLQSQLTEGYFLPGGRLRPGECEENGLRRKLTAKLSPVGHDVAQPDWDIGDLLANWWDIDFSRRMYPYIPAHVTKPKEQLVLYSVTLPEKFTFAVPKNLQLVAVPLFELHDNAANYGTVIAAIPSLLSRSYVVSK